MVPPHHQRGTTRSRKNVRSDRGTSDWAVRVRTPSSEVAPINDQPDPSPGSTDHECMSSEYSMTTRASSAPIRSVQVRPGAAEAGPTLGPLTTAYSSSEEKSARDKLSPTPGLPPNCRLGRQWVATAGSKAASRWIAVSDQPNPSASGGHGSASP